MQYVVARTNSKRPTLMHKVSMNDRTACGLDMSYWSRAYLEFPVPQIMCLKCVRKPHESFESIAKRLIDAMPDRCFTEVSSRD